jgi:putative intracellular protease/amidase
MMKKILMVLTSHKDIPKIKSTTGVWLGEFTEPYYEFVDMNYLVTLASPKGGEPPIDLRSRLTEELSASNRRFEKDELAQEVFRNTVKLNEVNAVDFDGIFYPGGHGPMWDLAQDETNAALLLDFHKQEKAIGAVCHGPAAFLLAAEKDPHFLPGYELTAFSNTEEKLVGLYTDIPFKLEDRLKELGAKYEKASIPFMSKIIVSGKIVTGQNPASAGKTAKDFIKVVRGVDTFGIY